MVNVILNNLLREFVVFYYSDKDFWKINGNKDKDCVEGKVGKILMLFVIFLWVNRIRKYWLL